MGDWTGGKGWGERSQHVSADKEKVYPQGLDTIGALALCTSEPAPRSRDSLICSRQGSIGVATPLLLKDFLDSKVCGRECLQDDTMCTRSRCTMFWSYTLWS